MKVVVDGRCIPNQLDGTGRVTINLIEALSNSDDNLDLQVLIRSDLSKIIREKIPGSIRVLNIPYRHIHPYTVFGLGRVIDKLRADIFYSPHMLQPFSMSTPGVITIHDTMWFESSMMQAHGKQLIPMRGPECNLVRVIIRFMLWPPMILGGKHGKDQQGIFAFVRGRA